jgi:hypothetical protein
MSITQKKVSVKKAPRSAESIAGGQYLMDLLKRGDDLDYPRRQVAGLSDTQFGNIDLMQDWLTNGTEGENLAMDEFKKILGDEYDPRTSDFYKGFRDEANALKTEEASAIRRRSQMGGMLNSSPSVRAEADNNRRWDNMVLQQLGQMYETERGRKTQAAGSAADLGQRKVGNMLTSQDFMDQARQITQQEYNAAYEEIVQELLAPYSVVAPVAVAMMNHSQDYYSTGGGDKDWVKDMGIISGMAGGLFM